MLILSLLLLTSYTPAKNLRVLSEEIVHGSGQYTLVSSNKKEIEIEKSLKGVDYGVLLLDIEISKDRPKVEIYGPSGILMSPTSESFENGVLKLDFDSRAKKYTNSKSISETDKERYPLQDGTYKIVISNYLEKVRLDVSTTAPKKHEIDRIINYESSINSLSPKIEEYREQILELKEDLSLLYKQSKRKQDNLIKKSKIDEYDRERKSYISKREDVLNEIDMLEFSAQVFEGRLADVGESLEKWLK